MEFVKLEGNRSGYTPEQCPDTLTVGALIEVLSQFDEDMPVYLKNDDGYARGGKGAATKSSGDAVQNEERSDMGRTEPNRKR